MRLESAREPACEQASKVDHTVLVSIHCVLKKGEYCNERKPSPWS